MQSKDNRYGQTTFIGVFVVKIIERFSIFIAKILNLTLDFKYNEYFYCLMVLKLLKLDIFSFVLL